MVDVQVDALGAFEQDVLTGGLGLLDLGGGVLQIGRDARSDGQQLFADLVLVQGVVLVELAQQDVLFQQGVMHFFAHQLRVGQVTGTQAHAGGLVLIAGADAATGGADLLAGTLGFAGIVQALVVGHDQVGLFADAQTAGGHVDALGRQFVHFLEEDEGVQHHTVADQAVFALVQDARGDQVQDGLLALDLDGVAGVVAALETHDQPALRAEHVHNLSLALVAPLGADNDRICHISTCTARMTRAKAEVLSSTRENPVA